MNSAARIVPVVLLCLFAFCPAVSWGQKGLEAPVKGEFYLKTNPLQYFYPEFNLSAEYAFANRRTLELKFGYFPKVFYRNLDWTRFPELGAAGFSAHLMHRRYASNRRTGLFMAYGLLVKHWKYRDNLKYFSPDNGQSVLGTYRESAASTSVGAKWLLGLWTPWPKAGRMAEIYVGLSMKIQVNEYEVTETSWGENCWGCPSGTGSGFALVPGLHAGINLGLDIARRSDRSMK